MSKFLDEFVEIKRPVMSLIENWTSANAKRVAANRCSLSDYGSVRYKSPTASESFSTSQFVFGIIINNTNPDTLGKQIMNSLIFRCNEQHSICQLSPIIAELGCIACHAPLSYFFTLSCLAPPNSRKCL